MMSLIVTAACALATIIFYRDGIAVIWLIEQIEYRAALYRKYRQRQQAARALRARKLPEAETKPARTKRAAKARTNVVSLATEKRKRHTPTKAEKAERARFAAAQQGGQGA